MEAGPKKAELWNFSVKIQNKRTGMSVETTCSVAPLDWKIEDIQTSGNYLTITLHTVAKLCLGISVRRLICACNFCKKTWYDSLQMALSITAVGTHEF